MRYLCLLVAEPDLALDPPPAERESLTGRLVQVAAQPVNLEDQSS